VRRKLLRRIPKEFESAAQIVNETALERTAAVCGVPEEHIYEAARSSRARRRPSRSTARVSISPPAARRRTPPINLPPRLRQVASRRRAFQSDRPAPRDGGREVGGMANLLSAHRELGKRAAQARRPRSSWGVEAVSLEAGKTAVEMFDAVRAGEIKIVWIACHQPGPVAAGPEARARGAGARPSS